MTRSTHLRGAGGLILLGAAVALLFGGQAGTCLGPSGVTAVQCAQATGIVPAVGVGLPFLALMIAAATFIVAPVPTGQRGRVLVAATIGGMLGPAIFLVLAPSTMTGLDSSGASISIARPLDADALAATVIAAAWLGTMVVRLGLLLWRQTTPDLGGR